MKLLYADNHTWRKTIHPDIFPDFGKNNTKKLKSLLSGMEEQNISYTFESLAKEFFVWFSPLYDSLIASRENFGGYDIIESTLNNTNSKYPYFSFSLLIDNVPIGGAIFTMRKNKLSLVYRAFPSKFPESIDTRCTPALLAEYLLTVYTVCEGKEELAHGADKNPYGINSAIGLAIFKLSVGCKPFLQKTFEVRELDLETLTHDVLVLEYPSEGKRINEAALIATEESLSKYQQLFKYTEQLKIKTYIRNS